MSRRLAVGAGVAAMVAALAPPASADQGAAVLGAVRDDGGRLGQVVVVAGTGREGYSGDGWSARDARITDASLSVGPDGTVYLAQYAHGRVRAVTPSGIIDTVPGTVARQRPRKTDPAYAEWRENPADSPHATAVGTDGSLYIAGSETVTRRLPDGTIVRVAGGGDQEDDGTGGDGGPATEANLLSPTDVAVDAAGTVYVADLYSGRVHRIDASGTITTVAGGGPLAPEAAQGRPATEVGLDEVSSVAVDSAGTLYFATRGDAKLVGKVAPDGTFTTVIGADPADAWYGGIAVDGDDNLYVNDLLNGLIREVTPDGDITDVGPVQGGADLAVGPDGDIYSSGGGRVYRLVRHGEPPAPVRPARRESRWADREPGTVETVLGTGAAPAEDAPVVDHESPGPDQVAVAPDGTVYYVDTSRVQVGSVAPDGTISVLAGPWEEPTSVAVGPDGEVYVIDTRYGKVHRIDPGADGTTVIDTPLEKPRGVAVDAAGTLYVADAGSGGGVIHRIGADGTASVVAGGGDLWDDDGENQPATSAALGDLATVAVDQAGTLYFQDTYLRVIWRMGPDGVLRTGPGSPFGGVDYGFGGDGGPADLAEVNNPGGLATGPDGSLYLADTLNNRVRRVTPDGVIATVAGTGEPAEKGDDGPAVEAALLEPTGIAVGEDGTVYVTSPVGGTIRRIDPDGTITTLTRFTPSPAEGRPATEAPIRFIEGVTVDGAGTPSVLVNQDQLRSVDEAGRLHVDNVAGTHVVTGQDGSTYVAGPWTVDRHYPDGTVVPMMGRGQATPADGQPAISAGMIVTDVALGPDGELYVAGDDKVFRIDEKGLLDLVVAQAISGMAVGPDGSLYAAVPDDNRVLRIRDGETTTFAGNGESWSEDDDRGDGGPATSAIVWSPRDVEVAPDGTVYVSSIDGIRRIATDGTIETILRDGDSNVDGPENLALDAHGNLYFTEPQLFRVRVVVAPGEMVIPGFGWDTMWLGVNLAVAAFVFVEVRRRRLLEEVVGRPE